MHFSADYIEDDFWVGIGAHTPASCDQKGGTSCLNKLYWVSDGAPYNHFVNAENIVANDDEFCFRIMTSHSVSDADDCFEPRPFACEFNCEQGEQGLLLN